MKLKLIGGVAIAALVMSMAVAFVPKLPTNLAALSMSRSVTSTDYTTEFYGRAVTIEEDIYLTYTSKKLESTATIEDSKYIINFTSTTTATLKNGNTFLGWGGSGTDITEAEYEWYVQNGALYTNDEGHSRVLMYQAGTANTGKVYAVNNIGKTNYYPIVFYTKDQYDEAVLRCNWTDVNRQQALNNLKYEMPVRYTLSFNANGGSGTMTDRHIIANTEYTLPGCDFTYNGKEFDGWSLTSDGDKLNSPLIMDSNKTLFALWKIPTTGTVDFTLTSAASVTKNGITITFAKGSGSNAPAWYAAGLRLYAKNTITITSTNTISQIDFNWEKQGSKAFASVTANIGDYTHPSAAGVGTWEGSQKTIVFTLGESGQLQLNTFSVTLA